MRCPLCGEKFNPVDAMLDAEWLEIISAVMPTFGGHAKLAFVQHRAIHSPSENRQGNGQQRFHRRIAPSGNFCQAGHFSWVPRATSVSESTTMVTTTSASWVPCPR